MTIRSVGVIGAGIMGNGIAQTIAVAGIDVVLVDVNDVALERGVAKLTHSLRRLVEKGTMAAEVCAETLARIQTSTQYNRLADVDLAIEAATENAELKARILRQVESTVGQNAIIASNTSSISITSLGATLADPSRFIGMHFFNPVPLVPLVEVIRGMSTSEATFESVRELSVRLHKTPVNVKNSPGFVVNRVLVPMINEAFFLLAEGVATAEDIDSALQLGAKHPIGPLALADLIGLDTCLSILEVLQRDLGDPKYRPCGMLRELVAAGQTGRKVGRGVFRYDPP